MHKLPKMKPKFRHESSDKKVLQLYKNQDIQFRFNEFSSKNIRNFKMDHISHNKAQIKPKTEINAN